MITAFTYRPRSSIHQSLWLRMKFSLLHRLLFRSDPPYTVTIRTSVWICIYSFESVWNAYKNTHTGMDVMKRYDKQLLSLKKRFWKIIIGVLLTCKNYHIIGKRLYPSPSLSEHFKIFELQQIGVKRTHTSGIPDSKPLNFLWPKATLNNSIKYLFEKKN